MIMYKNTAVFHIVTSSRMSVLLIPGLPGDSPLAQLVKELDLCLYLCVIRRL